MGVRTTVISQATRRMGRRGSLPLNYEMGVREYLYMISYRFLGMPPPGNAWLYPDVFLWDEDGYGDNVIPALIAFYFDRSYRYPWDKRHDFHFQLADHVPGPWQLYWIMEDGYIWAERQVEGIQPTLPLEIQERSLRAMTLEDDDYRRNGHRKVADGNDLLMVPYAEHDSG